MCKKGGGGGGGSMKIGSLGIPNKPVGKATGSWWSRFTGGQTAWTPFAVASHPPTCRWRRFCEALRLA
jgi:hypothetical protein